jgi:Arsenite-resistance protein 2
MSSFMAKTADLEVVELKKLGAKDTDAEVEKFILANSQELSKEKWLCPLSGKKFKGPDFIRKHIFNKHGEKVDEVRKEVEFYNNYLKDVKRPQLPEHPGNVKKGPEAAAPAMHGAGGGYRPGPYGMPYGAPYGFQPPMMQSAPRPRHGYGGRGR